MPRLPARALACLAVVALLPLGRAAVAQDAAFLSDYARLKRDTDTGVAYWVRAEGERQRYDKLLVETIRVEPAKEQIGGGTIDAEDLRMLSDYFNDAIRREASAGGWVIVNEPAEGTLRLRMRVSDVQPNRPEVGLLVLAAPFGTVAEAAITGVATGTPGKAPYMGGVSVEAQFVDAQTNDVVVELQDKRAGNRLSVEGGVEGLATSYVSGLTLWGYVKQSFDYWAKWIRARTEALRATKAAA